MYIPRAFARQEEFFDAVAQVAGKLQPGVVSITPKLGEDYDGEPSVVLEAVLAGGLDSDERSKLRERVRWTIRQEILPMEEWGVLPYFRFRSQSAQEQLEPALR